MGQNYLFTSESVTEGHPDKMADQVSDAILDDVLSKDSNGKVACEALLTTGLVFVAGEISTNCYVDVPKIVRNLIREIGYTDPHYAFDFESCSVLTAIQEQSADIALGVDIGGAGDQGMMFGYAVNETPELMPLPIMLAHKLVRRLSFVRKENILNFLRPDGKSQVSIEYKNGVPSKVHTVVMSAQHNPDVEMKVLKEAIIEEVIKKTIPKEILSENVVYHINPTGRFEIGGPHGDTGLTGRKIIVDTYGGFGSHGGGCFSGKDPTKVDRSACYMCRYIAKNIVAAGLAKKCEIQLSYAIGIAEPLSIMINTYGTGKIADEKLAKIVRDCFDLTPQGIISTLDLKRPVFKKTAVYGHFGREEEGFTWEIVNKIEDLKKEAGI
ncbi:MAG: methionine adenosyltransferase [bacterium]